MLRPLKLIGPDRTCEQWRWQVLTITWLAYVGFYLTRKSFAVAKIGIQDDPSLRMSDVQMGWIDGANLSARVQPRITASLSGVVDAM